MRPRTTNLQRQAFDAYQPTFESAGALGLRRILRVCLARLPILPSLRPGSHALAFTLALPEVSYENVNR